MTRLDRILKSFNRTITKLEALSEARIEDATRYRQDAADLEFKGNHAFAEGKRAAKIAENLRELLK